MPASSRHREPVDAPAAVATWGQRTTSANPPVSDTRQPTACPQLPAADRDPGSNPTKRNRRFQSTDRPTVANPKSRRHRSRGAVCGCRAAGDARGKGRARPGPGGKVVGHKPGKWFLEIQAPYSTADPTRRL